MSFTQDTLTFSIGGPIVPGQPLTFSWELLVPLSNNEGIGWKTKVIAKVLFNDQLLYQSPTPVPFYILVVPVLIPIPSGGFYVSDEAIGYVASETPLPVQVPMGGLANLLYKIGTHTLQLVVSEPTGSPLWVAEATINVVPESVDSSWWVWDPAPSPLWGNNNPYTVSGTFTNKSNWSNMTFNDTFVETEEDNGNQLTRGSGSIKVGTGESRQVFSNNITQDWEFIIKAIWVPDGPEFKLFDYILNFSLQDDYNNIYPIDGTELTSSMLVVLVSVATWKWAAAGAATGFVADAVGFLAAAALALAGIITAGLAPGLFYAASLSYAAANIAGATALDPPVPDPNFKESVKVKYQKIPSKLLQTKGLSAIASYVSTTLKIMEQIAVLDSIHGKILGARHANVENGILTQVASYQSNVNLILNDFVNLVKYAKEAQNELDKLVSPTKRAKISFELLKKGLTSKMRKIALDAGVPKSTLSNLEQAIKKLPKSKVNSSQPILTSTMQMLKLIREVQKNNIAVVKSATSKPNVVF